MHQEPVHDRGENSWHVQTILIHPTLKLAAVAQHESSGIEAVDFGLLPWSLC